MPLRQLKTEIQKLKDSQVATFAQRFFRTGPGEYGEGDLFLGIRVPVLRKLAKQYGDLTHEEITELMQSKWHEERAIALMILCYQYAHGSALDRQSIFAFYMCSTEWINNWDLVDLSARKIVGEYLGEHPENHDVLRLLSQSSSLWERRIAIVSTHYFILKGEFQPTLVVCQALIKDKHDLIHKAMGWMLREVGKKEKTVLVKFLNQYRHQLPRTSLRYAIERFSPDERKAYLAK